MAPDKPLHHGKLIELAKTMVTEMAGKEIADRARKANCSEADFLRELIYMGLTGHTFSDLVAKDRRAQVASKAASEYQGSTS